MKKQPFVKKLDSVFESAQNFLKENVKPGKKIVLLSNKQLDRDRDKIYDLPSISYVDKYFNYIEYAVVSIQNKKGEIILNGIEKGENSNARSFTLPETSSDPYGICLLADMIAEKL